MASVDQYELVRLHNGVHSIRSLDTAEIMHPGIGPVAEAAALYVDQLQLKKRLAENRDGFVIWDVGLGAAANALTVLAAARQSDAAIHVVSFDHSVGPLRFALRHADTLGYFEGYQQSAARLLETG